MAQLLPRLLGCLMVAGVLFTSTAHAGEGRVVIIDVEPRVADALVVALSPWSLAVVRTSGPSPAPDIDSASARARAIANDQHAGAVVWINPPKKPSERGSLWVYEAQTMALAVRPLTVSAPFDDAGAAAVALSVKTILRAGPLVGPEPPGDDASKRAGASTSATGTAASSATATASVPANATASESAPGPARAPGPASAPASASAPGSAPVSTPALGSAAAPAPAPPSATATAASNAYGSETPGAPAAPSRRSWRIETIIGARAPTGASATLEPRAALGASLWHARQLGVGLQVQAGPGVSVGASDFQGELREGVLAATGRIRVPGDRWLAFEFQAGPALVLSSLVGQARVTGKSLQALKLDPAFNGAAIVDFILGTNISAGLIVEASALLRFQRYAVDGQPLLHEPSFVVLSGFRLSVEVD